MFRNRIDAGRRLAAALADYKAKQPLVFGLARGGVPVAAEVAKALDAPLRAVLVRKIGAPGQPELAVGAVADGDPPATVWNDDLVAAFGLDAGARASLVRDQMRVIEERRARFGMGASPAPVQGRAVIVVDDGLATGATAKAALRAMRARGPSELILAVPVAPPETLDGMQGEADKVICLETPAFFMGVGNFYENFRQTSDDEVAALLGNSAQPSAGEHG